MAQPQRQPLSELPLSRYLPVDSESSSSSSSKFKKGASLSPAGILSPPKRRILAAEGLLSPSSSSKSPARRLLFASAADTPRSGSGSPSMISQLAADMVQVAMASTPHHHSSSSSGSSLNYSSLSSSSSSSLVSSPTMSSRSASKLSIDTSANPSTPQTARTRPRPLAPSPEIVDSPMSFADEGPVTRPASLKRLRSTDSSSGAGGLTVNGGAPSPTKSPTPKRRNLARATSPSPAPQPSTSSTLPTAAEAEDLFDTEAEDKENVPPPRRRKPISSGGGVFKAPLPPTSTKTALGLRDMSATPRAVKTREPTYGTYLSPADIRTRRMAMEAEVDMPDCDENMQY